MAVLIKWLIKFLKFNNWLSLLDNQLTPAHHCPTPSLKILIF